MKFTEDPAVHDRLFKQFKYLMDYPLNIKGNCIEEAQNIGILETDDFLGFVMGYSPTEESAIADHFLFLSKEDNLKVNHHQVIQPVIPWPQPTIGVQLDNPEQGRVTGTHGVDVVMKQIGTVQLFWGQDIGILWEAILYGDITQRDDFEAIMNQLWGCCESTLKSYGCRKVFTYNRDPEYPVEWYRAFLSRHGYRPTDKRESAVCKEL